MFPTPFSIRDKHISPGTVLAPMAGVTDTVFRRMIRGLGGCGLIMTEFTSAECITRNSARTSRYLFFEPDEHPITGQLFGADADVMGKAAGMVEQLRTAGFAPPYVLTWPTPSTWDIFCARMESLKSYRWLLGIVSEEIDKSKISVSDGLILRYQGRLGKLAGNCPAAALIAACTSRAAALISRSRSN